MRRSHGRLALGAPEIDRAFQIYPNKMRFPRLGSELMMNLIDPEGAAAENAHKRLAGTNYGHQRAIANLNT